MLTWKQLAFIQDHSLGIESAPAGESAPANLIDNARLNRCLRSDYSMILSGRREVRDIRERLVIREWLSKVLSLQYDVVTAAQEVLQKYRKTPYSKRVAAKFVRCWLSMPWTQKQIEEYHASMLTTSIRTREQVLAKLWDIAQAHPDGKMIKASDVISANELIGIEEFGMFKKQSANTNIRANNVNIAQMFREIDRKNDNTALTDDDLV